MDNKKTLPSSILGLLLVITIIIIAIMAYFLYQANTEKKNAIFENKHSDEQISVLENNSNINSNNLTEETTTNTITEKQSLTGAGYTITLYSNNEVKITPAMEDLQLILGINNIDNSNENYSVSNFSGEVEKMYQGNTGTSVDPITFFIMKDGTVQYIQPLDQIMNNNNIIPTSFKIDGKIDNLNNVIDLKTNSAEVIIAVTKDGKEIKIWNEWMEEFMQ